MRWEVQDVKPYEARAIVYKVPYLVTDFTEYSEWNLAQMVVVEASDIVVRDLKMPSLMANDKGSASFTLSNLGPVPQDVNVDIIAPQGWKATPGAVSITIGAHGEQLVTFDVQTPRNAPPGTYGVTLRLSYGNTYFDRQAFIYVYEPGGIYAPPISDQMSAWLGSLTSLYPIAMLLGAGLVVAAIAFVVYKRGEQPHYDEARLGDLRDLERMLQGEDDNTVQGRQAKQHGWGKRRGL